MANNQGLAGLAVLLVLAVPLTPADGTEDSENFDCQSSIERVAASAMAGDELTEDTIGIVVNAMTACGPTDDLQRPDAVGSAQVEVSCTGGSGAGTISLELEIVSSGGHVYSQFYTEAALGFWEFVPLDDSLFIAHVNGHGIVLGQDSTHELPGTLQVGPAVLPDLVTEASIQCETVEICIDDPICVQAKVACHAQGKSDIELGDERLAIRIIVHSSMTNWLCPPAPSADRVDMAADQAECDAMATEFISWLEAGTRSADEVAEKAAATLEPYCAKQKPSPEGDESGESFAAASTAGEAVSCPVGGAVGYIQGYIDIGNGQVYTPIYPTLATGEIGMPLDDGSRVSSIVSDGVLMGMSGSHPGSMIVRFSAVPGLVLVPDDYLIGIECRWVQGVVPPCQGVIGPVYQWARGEDCPETITIALPCKGTGDAWFEVFVTGTAAVRIGMYTELHGPAGACGDAESYNTATRQPGVRA